MWSSRTVVHLKILLKYLFLWDTTGELVSEKNTFKDVSQFIQR